MKTSDKIVALFRLDDLLKLEGESIKTNIVKIIYEYGKYVK